MTTKRYVQITALFLTFSMILCSCSVGAGPTKTAPNGQTTAPSAVSVSTTTEPAPTTTDAEPTVTTTTATALPTTKPTTPVAKTVDLMVGIQAASVTGRDANEQRFSDAHTQFAVKLLQTANRRNGNQNLLLSPLSVQATMAMVANGASGETLREIETALGGLPVAELNQYLHDYGQTLPQGDAFTARLACSLWFNSKGNAKVPKTFLQTVSDYYRAQVYRSSFDKQTITDMNRWVNEHTDGEIRSIVDRLPDKTVQMVLLNTVSFNAEWQNTYGKQHVFNGTFTTESGTKRSAEMMKTTETVGYFSDGEAVGFAKDFKDGYYSFVALLPNEGTSLNDYVASLTAAKIKAAISASTTKATITIPKFSYDCEVDMATVLSDMGIKTAFASGADFSGLDTSGKGTYLGEVAHKTHIDVSEEGVKAGAATSARVLKDGSPLSIALDRPFVYVIADNTTYLPLFIGTVTDIGQ